jgi:glycosidase
MREDAIPVAQVTRTTQMAHPARQQQQSLRGAGAVWRRACALLAACAGLVMGASAAAQTSSPSTSPLVSPSDPYTQRERDWRNGAIVYQVLVDRFAPSAELDVKKAQGLYAPPRRLRAWNEQPQAGTFIESAKVWSHEVDFWGGDLKSLRSRLDHVQGLGAEVLYLNPIHLGFTNHKYDSLDFQAVSPEYGTRDDVKALAADLRQRGLKLVLDGVFNHMGRNAPRFRQAVADPASPWRNWFVFDARIPGGARTWKGVHNLPELNLEHPPVRQHLWAAPDSVVRSYLRDGADGWRLDTAYELGHEFLAQLTAAAHAEKPGSLVVGEIVNYPAGWMPAMDGVMNFHLRTLLLLLLDGKLAPATASAMLERMVADVGIEPLLKSWVLLDNHDVQRVATEIPHPAKRRLAQVLQFTLPGAPNLYYGAEVGMTGGWDPAQRGPMDWDRVAAGHPDLAWTRQLIGLRKNHRALRVGDFRTATAQHLLAFERYTDRAADTVLVVANPTDRTVTEHVQWRHGDMMDASNLRDLLPPAFKTEPVSASAGFVHLTLPPYSVRVLAPDTGTQDGYSVYKRVR